MPESQLFVENVLFEKGHETALALITSLDKECRHQRDYIALIEDEKTALKTLKPYNIEECTAMREAVIAKVKAEQNHRISILKGILRRITTNRPELRLTTIAERVFHPDDTAIIKEKCAVLRDLIELNRRKTLELEGMVSFSMNLVTGSLATILKHVQVQVPLYNACGKVAAGTKTNLSGNRNMSRMA